ncbi:MAG: T9SS type A sorting domain-containing protein, partial [Chitinophagales bacterium]
MKRIILFLLIFLLQFSIENHLIAQDNKLIPPDNYRIVEYRDDGLMYKSVDAGANRVPIKSHVMSNELPEFIGTEIAWITSIVDTTVSPIYSGITDLRETLGFTYSTILSDGTIVACYFQNQWDGWVLKRIQPEDGTILWSRTVSKNEGGIRGYPSSIYESSPSTIELLWHRADTDFIGGAAPSYMARTTLQINGGTVLNTVSPGQEEGAVRLVNFTWPSEIRKQVNGSRFLVAETYFGNDAEGDFFTGKITITDEKCLPVADSILLYTSGPSSTEYVYFVDDVRPTTDNGFLIEYLESHKFSEGELDINYVAKVNDEGLLEWTKDVSEFTDKSFDIYPLADNRFFIAGSWDFDPKFATAEFRPFLSFYDAEGNIIWHKTYREEATEGGALTASIMRTKEGILFSSVEDFITKRKATIYESDMEGNISELVRLIPKDEDLRIEVEDIQELDTGDLIAQISILRDSITYDFSGQEIIKELRRLYVLKIRKEALFTDIEPSNSLFSELQVYPNPAREELTVSTSDLPANIQNGSIELHNTVGQLLLRVPIEGKETQLKVNELPKGLYLLRVMANKRVW